MNINVLLVDDEPLVIQDIAASVNWPALNVQHVFLAYSASEAMQEFDLHHIDVLICDIEMPKVNGLQLLAWVREHFPAVRSIILTCHPQFNYAQEALRLNCEDYILKPVDTNELELALKNIISKLYSSHPLRSQELFWKQCANGTYSDAYTLQAAAKKCGISIQDHTYLTVLIRPAMMTQVSDEQENPVELSPDIFNHSFSNICANYFFFLDYVHTLFGIFIISKDELPVITELVRCRLEELRYTLPVSIAAFFHYSEGLSSTVHTFSKLRNTSGRSIKSCITLPAGLGNTATPSFEFLKAPCTEIQKKEFLTQIENHMYTLPKEPARLQKALIRLRREIEDWFFTVLAQLGCSPSEILEYPQQKTSSQTAYISREQAIIDSRTFLLWADMLLTLTEKELHHNNQHTNIILQAREYIEQNLQLNLSRKDVANHVFLNADYLDRRFKSELGVSISQYMLQKKLDFAKHLLTDTDKSISDIALDIGYNNLSSFSHMFKHETGDTPMAYRKHKKD